MHSIGCPKRNNLYADCECERMELREHTEQLRRFNENAHEMVESLTAQLESVRAELNNEHEAVMRAKDAFSRIRALCGANDQNPNAAEWIVEQFIKQLTAQLEEAKRVIKSQFRHDGHLIGCSYNQNGDTPDTDYCTCEKQAALAALAPKQKERE